MANQWHLGAGKAAPVFAQASYDFEAESDLEISLKVGDHSFRCTYFDFGNN